MGVDGILQLGCPSLLEDDVEPVCHPLVLLPSFAQYCQLMLELLESIVIELVAPLLATALRLLIRSVLNVVVSL